ncbi:thermonuclease family protein [Silicimonas algicola]|uniref:Nuclease-like protein n=1 Tax=Silicimonas algicola TaxID=1826607 RepID=A0A316G7G1_9RHOB|nr:thermonuclease family protein [Silicimonas algicola]PWK56562.1 nuclease-like protein [Silicimonas algicola]
MKSFLLAATLFLLANSAHAIGLCGSGPSVTCVVDGDTFWLNGEKIRVQGYDTPETTTNICGGQREVELGRTAADRLMQLLNQGNVSMRRTGKDRYGRTLAIVHVDGRDVGAILMAEGLARRWPDGREFWCN